jgi:hypothetical protein
MNLPKRLFFTGVPGSRWSGIAQHLELMPDFNTTDRTTERTYSHHAYSGHKGAYFGRGMELPATLDLNVIDGAWEDPLNGTQIVKSHDWAYILNDVYATCKRTNDWIMLVYRNDLASNAWWFEVGGFQIKYPDYSAYGDYAGMFAEIVAQNKAIMQFGCDHDATWNYFTADWIAKTFNIDQNIIPVSDRPGIWNDILVSVVKP